MSELSVDIRHVRIGDTKLEAAHLCANPEGAITLYITAVRTKAELKVFCDTACAEEPKLYERLIAKLDHGDIIPRNSMVVLIRYSRSTLLLDEGEYDADKNRLILKLAEAPALQTGVHPILLETEKFPQIVAEIEGYHRPNRLTREELRTLHS